MNRMHASVPMSPASVEAHGSDGGLSIRFLRISAVWLVAGIVLGTFMGATHNHLDKQIHVHGNLLGWVSCALFAAYHRLWPAMASSALAHGHFWLHNIGLFALAAGLAMLSRGNPAAAPLLGVGSVFLVLASVVFLYLAWRAN